MSDTTALATEPAPAAAPSQFVAEPQSFRPLPWGAGWLQREPWPLPSHVLFIAEIGINHNGSIETARRLIDQAKAAGADVVKFQKRTIDIVYAPDVLAAPRESPWGTTQRDQKEGLEFGAAEYNQIDAYCRHVGIDWMASAWDVPSQHFLRQYGLKYNKIASPMITHRELLEAVAEEGRPTFISTGMSTFTEIDNALTVFRQHQCPVTLMHCVSEYPAPEPVLNLRCINTLRQRYNLPVGYSGHEVSVFPSAIAAMMGAVAIERHITLDRAMYGSDQAASIERRGMEQLIGFLRTIPIVLGDGVKRVTDAETAAANKLRYYSRPFWGV